MDIVFTGSYQKCKCGNLISISGDRGKFVNFNGKVLPQLAPKRSFWDESHNNISKVSFYDNTRYYIIEYYKQVLLNVNILELIENENEPVFLCYEPSEDFCHRHILAEYISIRHFINIIDTKLLSGV